MGWSFIILLVVGICLLIWIVVEFRRMKHKFVAFFLIFLILFFYSTGVYVFSGKKIDLSSASGLMNAGGVYMAWLGHAFDNAKIITANAIKMNWYGSGNQTKIRDKK